MAFGLGFRVGGCKLSAFEFRVWGCGVQVGLRISVGLPTC